MENGIKPNQLEKLVRVRAVSAKLFAHGIVKMAGPCRKSNACLDCPRYSLERFQPLLDFAHAARERELLAIFEQDDVFAARRRLDGFDAIQVHNR